MEIIHLLLCINKHHALVEYAEGRRVALLLINTYELKLQGTSFAEFGIGKHMQQSWMSLTRKKTWQDRTISCNHKVGDQHG